MVDEPVVDLVLGVLKSTLALSLASLMLTEISRLASLPFRMTESWGFETEPFTVTTTMALSKASGTGAKTTVRTPLGNFKSSAEDAPQKNAMARKSNRV